MIFTLALCLGVIAASAAGQHAESSDLNILSMVNVTERLVVVKRKHTTNTTFRCQSLLRVGTGNINSGYTYLLKARNGSDPHDIYNHSIVEVKLLPLAGGKGYKATYMGRAPGESNATRYNLTLKQVDSSEGCFVIFVQKRHGDEGCELIVPASKRNDTIPAECDNYYTNNCTGNSLQLYEQNCRYYNLTRDHNSRVDSSITGC
uniref:Putative secreted protein n=1 Tax=Amblyomma cajennense TaxID=34607 RepID=A0A023FS08_AMBCJ